MGKLLAFSAALLADYRAACGSALLKYHLFIKKLLIRGVQQMTGQPSSQSLFQLLPAELALSACEATSYILCEKRKWEAER